MNDNLGPQPEPTVEPKEANPGGADAIVDDEDSLGVARDLNPDDNPAVDDVLPDEITEPDDDKKQAPEGQADDQESGAEDTPEAGQENEEGDPEEPA